MKGSQAHHLVLQGVADAVEVDERHLSDLESFQDYVQR